MAGRKGLVLSGVCVCVVLGVCVCGGGITGFDQWVSDVMTDSFSGKLKGLACLLPKMSEF